MEEKHLVIRADAGAQMGIGHLMRCLALGQAWKDAGGRVVFVTACSNESLVQRLCSEGFAVHRLEHPYPEVRDWQFTQRLLVEHPGAWLVLDGYQFDSAYQRQVKQAGYRLMVIDDMAHLPHYYADIVLNQNLHGKSLRYSGEPYTRLLVGTQYVLLRREFLEWRGGKREIPDVARKVLVTLGGTENHNVALKVLGALQHVDVEGLQPTVVMSESNAIREAVRAAASNARSPIHLTTDVTNMAELMAWADVAVSAGGSTCWELAFMGLPALILTLAENQRPVGEALGGMGAALNLGAQQNVSGAQIAEALTQLLGAPERRAEMARRGRAIVDGEGTARVLMHLEGRVLRLRRARQDDCRLFWEWTNDPEVRAASFSSESIPWEGHLQWFARKMQDANCFLFIALGPQDTPVGQIRFDVNETQEAEISLSIDRGKRGLGYGRLLIGMAVEEMFRRTPVQRVHAFVKPDNPISSKAFERAGFATSGMETVRGSTARHYVCTKDK